MKRFYTKNIAKEYFPDGYIEVIDFFLIEKKLKGVINAPENLFINDKYKIGYAMIRNRHNNIFIELVEVYPKFRNKGYGAKIVEYLHKKIKLLKLKEVYLIPRDKAAESFWKHFGYKQYRESNYLIKIL